MQGGEPAGFVCRNGGCHHVRVWPHLADTAVVVMKIALRQNPDYFAVATQL
jgi:hypothetical protein